MAGGVSLVSVQSVLQLEAQRRFAEAEAIRSLFASSHKTRAPGSPQGSEGLGEETGMQEDVEGPSPAQCATPARRVLVRMRLSVDCLPCASGGGGGKEGGGRSGKGVGTGLMEKGGAGQACKEGGHKAERAEGHASRNRTCERTRRKWQRGDSLGTSKTAGIEPASLYLMPTRSHNRQVTGCLLHYRKSQARASSSAPSKLVHSA